MEKSKYSSYMLEGSFQLTTMVRTSWLTDWLRQRQSVVPCVSLLEIYVQLIPLVLLLSKVSSSSNCLVQASVVKLKSSDQWNGRVGAARPAWTGPRTRVAELLLKASLVCRTAGAKMLALHSINEVGHLQNRRAPEIGFGVLHAIGKDVPQFELMDYHE